MNGNPERKVRFGMWKMLGDAVLDYCEFGEFPHFVKCAFQTSVPFKPGGYLPWQAIILGSGTAVPLGEACSVIRSHLIKIFSSVRNRLATSTQYVYPSSSTSYLKRLARIKYGS